VNSVSAAVSIMLIHPLKISNIEINTQAPLDHDNDGGMFTNNRGIYIGFMSVRQSEGKIGSIIA